MHEIDGVFTFPFGFTVCVLSTTALSEPAAECLLVSEGGPPTRELGHDERKKCVRKMAEGRPVEEDGFEGELTALPARNSSPRNIVMNRDQRAC